MKGRCNCDMKYTVPMLESEVEHEEFKYKCSKCGEWCHNSWMENRSIEMVYKKCSERKPPNIPVVRDKPKVSRNSLCSCGSGIKYKRCCLSTS